MHLRYAHDDEERNWTGSFFQEQQQNYTLESSRLKYNPSIASFRNKKSIKRDVEALVLGALRSWNNKP